MWWHIFRLNFILSFSWCKDISVFLDCYCCCCLPEILFILIFWHFQFLRTTLCRFWSSHPLLAWNCYNSYRRSVCEKQCSHVNLYISMHMYVETRPSVSCPTAPRRRLYPQQRLLFVSLNLTSAHDIVTF